MMPKLILATMLMVLSVLLGACEANRAAPSPEPSANDAPVINKPDTNQGQIDPVTSAGYAPKPADENLSPGNVYLELEKSEFLLLESFPVQVNLVLRGNLPTPCHFLRVKINPPDANRQIFIDIYSVTDSSLLCAQVLQPFETSVSLGSFESGKYTVYLNGEYLGEFEV